jgi:1-acyl-sn-glycerol-3-phosphate acyltransferase
VTLKAAVRLVAALALAAALIPFQLAALRLRSKLARRLPVLFHRGLLKILGVRVEVRGGPEGGRPLLVVSNHVSWLDIPVLGAASELCFVAKSEVADWPIIGTFAKLQRTLFIERERRHKTGEAAAKIGARLADGDVVVLFAEGTTSDGVRVLPFRSALVGAAREAACSGHRHVLVQPLAVRYARRDGLPISRAAMQAIAWTGDTDLVPHLLGVLSGGPIDAVVSWGGPLPFNAGTDRKSLSRLLEASVRAMMKSG